MSACSRFESAVSSAVGNIDIRYCREQCPDQYVGKICEFDKVSQDFPVRLSIKSAPSLDSYVLLILESPHIEEFKQPPGPTKGKTGTLIRKHIGEILRPHVSTDSGLILMNAIQHQCSLGVSTKKHRDTVFRAAWAAFAQEEFTGRLSALVDNKRCFIMNACTIGKTKKSLPSLRQLVENTINDTVKRPSDLVISHPVSWWSAQNRVPRMVC